MNVLPRFSPDWMAGFRAPQPLPPVDFKQSFAAMAKTALHFGLTNHDAIATALSSTSFAADLVVLKDSHSSSVREHFLNAEMVVPQEHHCSVLVIKTPDQIYEDGDGEPLIECKITGLPYVIEYDDSFGKLADEQRAVIRMALEILCVATDGVVQPDFMECGNGEYIGSWFYDAGGEELVDSFKELIASGVSFSDAADRVLEGYAERDDDLSDTFSADYVLEVFDDLRVEAENKVLMDRFPKITDAGELLAKASSLFLSDALTGWFAQLAFFLENHPPHTRPMNEFKAPRMEQGEVDPDLLMNITRSPYAFTLVEEVAENMMQIGEEACLRLWAKNESDLEAVRSHISRIRSGLHMTAWLENCVQEELAYSETSSTETAAPQEIAA